MYVFIHSSRSRSKKLWLTYNNISILVIAYMRYFVYNSTVHLVWLFVILGVTCWNLCHSCGKRKWTWAIGLEPSASVPNQNPRNSDDPSYSSYSTHFDPKKIHTNLLFPDFIPRSSPMGPRTKSCWNDKSTGALGTCIPICNSLIKVYQVENGKVMAR